MSYKIRLTNNIENGQSVEFYANERTLRKIENYQYAGGFLRFGIDIIEESTQRPNARPLRQFFKYVFTESELNILFN